MDYLQIIGDAEEKFAKALAELPRVNARELGLDPQAGNVWVDTTNGKIITVLSSQPLLEYMGGFEYVDREYVTTFGSFVLYDGDDERIADALNYYEERS